MIEYRRAIIEGATYFFTAGIIDYRRTPIFRIPIFRVNTFTVSTFFRRCGRVPNPAQPTEGQTLNSITGKTNRPPISIST